MALFTVELTGDEDLQRAYAAAQRDDLPLALEIPAWKEAITSTLSESRCLAGWLTQALRYALKRPATAIGT